MKFSFIVPCYNTADYIGKCIDSIIQQTFKDWEMILINDGSTDQTADILHEYEKKDKRIKVIFQENSGLSAARNTGIDRAMGDYLLFLDSDDWYGDKSYLQMIADKCKDGHTEIVAFQYNEIANGTVKKQQNNLQYFEDTITTYTGEQFLQVVLGKENLYGWYSWLYAFRRTFWLDNKIRFDEKVYYYEDVNIIYRIILIAKRISILKEPIYQYYVGRKGQLTYPSSKSIQGFFMVCKKNIDYVTNLNLDMALKNLLTSNFSHTYFWILILVYYLPKKDRKNIFEMLNNDKFIMNYTSNKRDLIIKRMIRVFGLHITAGVLFLRSKWRNL